MQDSEALLPLIEQELDSLSHAHARPSMRQTSGLGPVSSRAQETWAAAARASASPRLDRCARLFCIHAPRVPDEGSS